MPNQFSRDVIFSRMLGLVSQKELDLLKDKTIAVPGCGGVGYTHAETLVRMGVGGVTIADFDSFAPENFNRQFGASIETVGKKKAEVLEARLKSINPAVRTRRFDGISKETVEDFLEGVDVVCDALDYFVIEPRLLMYRRARERGIAVVISCPIGFGATSHNFDPEGMAFEHYFDIRPEMSEREKLVNFGIGLNPAGLHKAYLEDPKLDFETRKVASLSSACLLATTLSASFAFAKLLGRPAFFKAVPYVYQVDYVAGRFVEAYVPEGVRAILKGNVKYRRQ